jgi:hypothetical protein
METQQITPETVLSCGHRPTPQPAGSCVTGYGIDMRGFTRCFGCAEAHERETFERAGAAREPFVAYLSGDPKVRGSLTITTWTGAEIAKVTSAKEMKTPYGGTLHGDKWLSYTAVDAHGREWFGRGTPGVVTSIRRKGK